MDTGSTTSVFDQMLNAIDISTVSTTVVTVALTIVGIYLAFKGLEVAKRVISKV